MNKHIRQSSWEENTEYYEAPGFDLVALGVTILISIGLVALVADIIFGAEVMTEWYASLITK